jgi:hypothetical protein
MTTRINAKVTVIEICEFARENLWVGEGRYGDGVWEKFVAITMRGDDGQLYKNFTKFNRAFATSVSVGDTFTLSAEEKEYRLHADGGYTAVVYCHKGLTKAEIAAQKKAEKKAKRLAKLGLTA